MNIIPVMSVLGFFFSVFDVLIFQICWKESRKTMILCIKDEYHNFHVVLLNPQKQAMSIELAFLGKAGYSFFF